MSDVISLSIQGEIAVLKIKNPPVNALSAAVRTELVDTVETMTQGDEIKAIVIVGDGRCFSAGADISEFGTTPPADTPTLPETIATLENVNIPVVAGIHGFALGGGLEIALGAHYRITTPDAKLGLPEVDIGIIPGAGGTQRLPRLIGIKAAAHLVATAEKISGEEAMELGLVEIVTETDDMVSSAIAFAETLIDQEVGPRPTSMITDRIDSPDDAKEAVEEVRQSISRKVGGRQAPARGLDSVLNAASMSFEDGMKAEREIFLSLRDGPEARALRHLFKAEREAQRITDVPDVFSPPTIMSAGVVGLGTMGQGIALVLARAGIEVVAIEIDEDRLDNALDAIRAGLQDRVNRDRMSQEQMDDELARITGATDYAALADVDLVIEAALEDMDIKKRIFAELDAVCPPHAILSTNTSSLDIDEIASATGRADQIVGAHFFAPAQVMKLLEIVRGSATSPETAATMMSMAKKIGKVGVAVGNAFGFVGNRMYHRYTWQAYFMLQEGATPAQVDAAMQSFGFPLGCLSVGDISGLDVAWRVRQVQKEIGDITPDMPYPVIADRICEKGWFGRKTGRGWYRYDDGKKSDDPEVAELIKSVAEELGIAPQDMSEKEIQDRCVFALINEGARLLEKGIVSRASDIDVIWRYGYGFPTWRGGPMFMAEDMGLPAVFEKLESLAEKYGRAFEPAGIIGERIEAGKKTFTD